MQILIADPQFQTTLFLIVFVILLLFSVRKSEKTNFFGIAVTNEMKGFAILAVIFSHIGYFLSKDTSFLFPVSIGAGVAVNLFLFLSGFGLTVSTLKSNLSVWSFYFKRLKKIFIPLWLVISLIFILDYFVLQRSYPLNTIIENYFGFYPKADLWLSLDSPLWYFSFIFFYYLIFPIVFWKRLPFLSPLLILLITQLVFQFTWPVQQDVFKLYKLHSLAFPLGVMLGVFYYQRGDYLKLIPTSLKIFFQKVKPILPYCKIILLISLIYIFAYTSIYSGVGKDIKIEQAISLVTMLSLIGIFLLKNIRIRLLEIMGIYSYEIYLFHWPILSRYDFLYNNIPAYLATILYLVIFLLIGWFVQRIITLLFDRPQKVV